MINKPTIEISDFSYNLPDERIAQFPLNPRDSSKLLIWKDGAVEEDLFRNLPHHLPDQTCLVFNDTRVINARLLFTKPTGSTIEIFCLEPAQRSGTAEIALQAKGSVEWHCLIGNLKRWKEDKLLMKVTVDAHEVEFTAKREANLPNGCFRVVFAWEPSHFTFAQIIQAAGKVPLPPYIHRPSNDIDSDTYQTIYAHHDGSVAAPTAGLHFTPHLLNELTRKGVQQEEVTLHVGLGTFRPVTTTLIADHEMHEERIIIRKSTVQSLLKHGENPILAVGTTSVRTLESLFWLGVNWMDDSEAEATVGQWDPYKSRLTVPSREVALTTVLNHLETHHLDYLSVQTSLLIAPGYSMRVVDGMVTNFHMPQSTLLLLIAAFMGKDWKRLYQYALEHEFRFLSYGDACLLLKRNRNSRV